MHDLRNLHHHQRRLGLRAGLLGCLVLLQVGVARAEIALDPSYDKFRATVTGNSLSVQYGGLSGSPLATSSNIKAVGAPGAVNASKGATLATKYGRLGFTASQRFSTLALARGVASLSLGPLSVGLALAAPAIYDWLTDSGVGIDPVTGDAREQSPGAIVCSMNTPGGVPRPGYTWHYNTGSQVGQWCGETPNGSVISAQGTIVSVGPAGLGDVIQKDTLTDMLTAHARASAELEAILEEIRQIDPEQPQPEAADAPVLNPTTDTPTLRKTETTTQPDGTVDTTTRDCKAVSKSVVGSPSSLKIVEECTVTKTSTPPAGSPTTTTTATSSDEAAQVDPATEATEDTDFCASLLGKLICTDLGEPSADEIPKATRDLSYTPEVLFGSGTCPADKVVTLGALTVPLTNMAQTCGWLADFVKPLAILLATFSATLIIIGAPKE